jgi:hypothetical protein
MIKVLHYDWRDEHNRDLIEDLQREIARHSEISYEFLAGSGLFEDDQENIEALLGDKDVFLAHPGLNGQRIIVLDYPTRFPRLRTGILSSEPHHYENGLKDIEDIAKLLNKDFKHYDSRRIQILDYTNHYEVSSFVLSAKMKN